MKEATSPVIVTDTNQLPAPPPGFAWAKLEDVLKSDATPTLSTLPAHMLQQQLQVLLFKTPLQIPLNSLSVLQINGLAVKNHNLTCLFHSHCNLFTPFASHV